MRSARATNPRGLARGMHSRGGMLVEKVVEIGFDNASRLVFYSCEAGPAPAGLGFTPRCASEPCKSYSVAKPLPGGCARELGN